MNITELKYVVETAVCGSATTAAKKLSVAQPNISRAISNVEKKYGIQIFERTPKGVILTREGQHFLEHAKRVVDELDYLSGHGKAWDEEDAELKIAIPKESYASSAFVRFIERIESTKRMRIHVRECSTLDALDCILKSGYHMAMLRFEREDEDYCRSIAQLNELATEEIMEYQLRVLTSRDGPITRIDIKGYDDLAGYIEVRQGDAKRMNGNYVDMMETLENVHSDRRIHVYERASQLALLRTVKTTYMWETPMPQGILKLNGLIEIPCPWQSKWMKDILLYPKKHLPERDEQIFIEELKKAAQDVLR